MRSKIWWVPAAISGLVATTHRTLATGPGGLAVTFDRPDPGKGETCIRLASYPARRADPALEPPRLAHTLSHQDLLMLCRNGGVPDEAGSASGPGRCAGSARWVVGFAVGSSVSTRRCRSRR